MTRLYTPLVCLCVLCAVPLALLCALYLYTQHEARTFDLWDGDSL